MFIDAVTVQGAPRFTKDGYLVATAKVARTGIQDYAGFEVGRPEIDFVKVWRPEGEVFHVDSLASYAFKPMTNEHPENGVSAETWKRDAIGVVGGDVLRDGDHISVPLILMDAAAIADYKDGKRELSMGYTAELVWGDGITPDGQPYNAIQKNIRINHCALVDKGRAGSAKIGDSGGHNSPSQTGVKTMTVKVKFGDVTIDVSEQAAEAIASLSEQLAQAKADAEKAKSESEAAAAAKDKELAAKDAAIDELKAQTMTADKLDAVIAERVALIAEAKKIADADYSGDAAAIRKQAVVAVLGDAAIAGKSEAYVEARFDVLRDGVKAPAQQKQISDSQSNKYLDRLQNGYKRGDK